MHTVGGGQVLDVSGSRRRRFRAEDLEALRVAEEGSIDDRILERIGIKGGLGLPEAELTQQLGQPPAEIHAAVAGLLQSGQLRAAGRGRLVTREAFEEAGKILESYIREQERAHPLRFGPMKSELKSRHDARVHPEVAESWIQQGIASGALHARGDRLRASGANLTLTPPLAELRRRMLAELKAKGFTLASSKELLDSFREAAATEMLQHLLSEEEIVKLSSDLLLHRDLLAELRRQVVRFYAGHTVMTVADLKEFLGVSRKQGVPLLEFLDHQQWTIRQGDVRARGPKLEAGA